MNRQLRCAETARSTPLGVTGTALRRTCFLVVDLALPWPSEIATDSRLVRAHAAAQARGSAGEVWTIVAATPRDGVRLARLTAYVLPDGAFQRYRSWVLDVESDAVDIAAEAMLTDLSRSGATEVVASEEVLLCTHGRRDACCGSLGTALWKGYAARGEQSVPVRRSSHLGGHRFAPTALLLPSGTMWGWLDAALLERIVQRVGSFSSVAGHFRGSTALATGAEQVVERAILEKEGWEWLDDRRAARSEAVGNVSHVRLHAQRGGTWTGVVDSVCEGVPLCGAVGVAKMERAYELRPGTLRHHE